MIMINMGPPVINRKKVGNTHFETIANFTHLGIGIK